MSERREVTIVNTLGLHARAATRLVKCAAGFAAELWLTYGERRVNGKSIMGVLTLAAARGARLLIEADGPDAADAVTAVAELVESGFGEAA